MHVCVFGGLIQMSRSACECLPTLFSYSLFRLNVNSQESDFYFSSTAAHSWTEHLKSTINLA